jgi:hypothetical protein
VQHLDDEPRRRRAEHDHLAAAAQYDPAQCPAAALRQGLVQHCVGVPGGRAIRQQVQTPTGKAQRIQLRWVEEAFQPQGPVLRRPQGITCTFWLVTLTTGHEVSIGENGSVYIPKKELVSVLQVLLQLRRLHLARTLPDALLLVRELEHFRVKVTTPRTETFESWREGKNDDLVFAVALAAWVGEQVGLSQPDSVHERGSITVSR